jgi:hypothetical protein
MVTISTIEARGKGEGLGERSSGRRDLWFKRGSHLRVRGRALEDVGLGDDEEDVLALRSGYSKSDFKIQEARCFTIFWVKVLRSS